MSEVTSINGHHNGIHDGSFPTANGSQEDLVNGTLGDLTTQVTPPKTEIHPSPGKRLNETPVERAQETSEITDDGFPDVSVEHVEIVEGVLDSGKRTNETPVSEAQVISETTEEGFPDVIVQNLKFDDDATDVNQNSTNEIVSKVIDMPSGDVNSEARIPAPVNNSEAHMKQDILNDSVTSLKSDYEVIVDDSADSGHLDASLNKERVNEAISSVIETVIEKKDVVEEESTPPVENCLEPNQGTISENTSENVPETKPVGETRAPSAVTPVEATKDVLPTTVVLPTEDTIKNEQSEVETSSTQPETPSATAVSEQSPVKSDFPSTVSGSVSDPTANSTGKATTTPEDATTESEAPKEEEWLDVLGNGLLKKKIIKRGKGERGKPGDLVTICYEGKLQDGTLVDKHNQNEFLLSDEDVIQAFDLAVGLMEDGEKALVYTDARYAYGIHGKKPKIAPNSHLTYEIEVLSVKPGPDFSTFTPKEKVAYADKKRDRGNQFYLAGDYIASINAYKRGLKQLENSGEKSVMDMRCKLLNNLSASQLKKEAFGAALMSLDAVLSVEPKNTKALFRKGKCLEGLGKDEEAFECLRVANALDPQNTLISQDLAKIKSRLSATQKKEKEMYGKMFQQNKKENTTSNEPSPWPYMIGSTVVAAVGVLTGLWWFRKTS